MGQPIKGDADDLVLGDYNAVCYECGRKFKASELLRHWQGYWVCPPHWEPRQPQDFVRGVKDVQTPPWSQPAPADVFNYTCDLVSSSAVTGVAVSGCARAGYVPANFLELLSTWVA